MQHDDAELKNFLAQLNVPVAIFNIEDGQIWYSSRTYQQIIRESTKDGFTFESWSANFISRGNRLIFSVDEKSYKVVERAIGIQGRMYRLIELVRTGLASSYADELAVTMSSVLVHRLRSPLTGVMGFLEMLKTDLGDSHSGEIRAIQQGLSEISNLADNLYLLTQNAGPHIQPISVKRLLDDLLNRISVFERQKISVSIAPGCSEMNSDLNMIRFVLRSLIENAVEATANGIGQVYVEVSETHIDIRNEGEPIPSTDVEKIFQPFFTTKARGVGVNLALARRYMKMLGGSLELRSNSSVDGVVFRCQFPKTK